MEDSSIDTFVCQCPDEFRSVCEELPFYAEKEGKQYCVLHFPSKDKEDDFRKAAESKLEEEDFDFRGVYFPEATKVLDVFGLLFGFLLRNPSFHSATFSGRVDFVGENLDRADFSRATFSEEADFSRATFSKEANFRGATFNKKANFSGATFSERAYFTEATFSERVYFTEATFSERTFFRRATFCGVADFEGAIFGGEAEFTWATFREKANFLGATFGGGAYYFDTTFRRMANFTRGTFCERVHFSRLKTFDETTFGFRNVTMEKPEQVSFHTQYLRPSWFVDADAQKVDFSEVEWFRLPGGDKLFLESEIEALKSRGIQPPESLRKLARACKRLMNNAEENRDYPTANEMHYWSMEAQRKEGWSRLGLIATLYWALSGYGVRPLRAFMVLLILSLVFALLFSWPYIGAPSSLQALEGLTYGYWGGPLDYLGYFLRTEMYSLGALARLNPEPKPTPGLFQTLVIVAGILGPLQIALFLLAVRRKVMR